MVLGHTSQPGLLEAKLLFDYTERMFHFGSDMSLGTLPPVEQLSFWRSRQSAALPRPQGDAALHVLSWHLLSLVQALVPGSAIDHSLFTVQQLCRHSHVMDMGRRGRYRMDQA